MGSNLVTITRNSPVNETANVKVILLLSAKPLIGPFLCKTSLSKNVDFKIWFARQVNEELQVIRAWVIALTIWILITLPRSFIPLENRTSFLSSSIGIGGRVRNFNRRDKTSVLSCGVLFKSGNYFSKCFTAFVSPFSVEYFTIFTFSPK